MCSEKQTTINNYYTYCHEVPYQFRLIAFDADTQHISIFFSYLVYKYLGWGKQANHQTLKGSKRWGALVFNFLDMVFQEKLWSISRCTHKYLGQGIWMTKEKKKKKSCIPQGRGSHLLENNLIETFCCLVNEYIAPYECIVCIWQMSHIWPLFELYENEIQMIFLV
jgi:hypothetical protein